ncbi:AraC family transcriptional regulator [Natronincola ferrireducens]|uniref:AraC-type DNA-binding protein n=1 Tax=Natronincola ferrireducens TaxID=393762 RepID=A0A1G9FSA9_9FIRM|nr:AraC family transcriptional regulator [Natronincola ferrireducens]SDK91232.1 AraC-type DNA-binding protein [Natronincola ferrireducens]
MKTVYGSKSMYKDSLTKKLEEFDYSLLQFGVLEKCTKDTISNEISTSFKAIVFTEGKCIIQYQETEYFLTKGDVLLLSPYIMYNTHFLDKVSVKYYYLYFDVIPDRKRSEFAQLFRCDGLAIYPKLVSDHVFPMIESSYKNIQQNRPGCNFSAKLVLLHLLLAMQQNPVDSHKKNTDLTEYSAWEGVIIRNCMKYIDSHMNKNIKVEDLCSHLGLSQAYLYKCFKKTFKLSTKEFLSVYRFRHIETELAQSNRPIHEISERFGYPSVYCFSSVFKKRYGISPLKYRQNCQIGITGSLELDNSDKIKKFD